MIVIKLLLNKQNFSLVIKGHAQYNPGNDIICAGVSTITQTFSEIVSELGCSDIVSEDGLFEVNGNMNDDILYYLRFVTVGYSGLTNSYPNNVRLEVIDEDNILNIKKVVTYHRKPT